MSLSASESIISMMTVETVKRPQHMHYLQQLTKLM
jgi:hypothetical protein